MLGGYPVIRLPSQECPEHSSGLIGYRHDGNVHAASRPDLLNPPGKAIIPTGHLRDHRPRAMD